ncbi:MAG: pentapeptide repeat-containing protein [Aggregatilineales bacterium]
MKFSKLFRHSIVVIALLVALSAITIHAQTIDDTCNSYDTITVSSPAIVDEGVDLNEIRCTTIFVEDEDGLITQVFVIPESLVGAYLRGVDLSGVDLTPYDLSYAVLRDATLQNVNASAVMFIETDFTNVDFTESDLITKGREYWGRLYPSLVGIGGVGNYDLGGFRQFAPNREAGG